MANLLPTIVHCVIPQDLFLQSIKTNLTVRNDREPPLLTRHTIKLSKIVKIPKLIKIAESTKNVQNV